MIYVFDTGPFRILFRNYYRSRFPSLWENFDGMITNNRIISVREVFREIERKDDDLLEWSKNNKEIFPEPSEIENGYVREIFTNRHFQTLVGKEERLSGYPVADPFIIAKARSRNGCVVTQEKHKPNAAKIPNVCEHFNIECTNLEGFMEKENWLF